MEDKRNAKEYFLATLLETKEHLELLDFFLVHQYVDYSTKDLVEITGIDSTKISNIMELYENMGLIAKHEGNYILAQTKLTKYFSNVYLGLVQNYYGTEEDSVEDKLE